MGTLVGISTSKWQKGDFQPSHFAHFALHILHIEGEVLLRRRVPGVGGGGQLGRRVLVLFGECDRALVARYDAGISVDKTRTPNKGSFAPNTGIKLGHHKSVLGTTRRLVFSLESTGVRGARRNI